MNALQATMSGFDAGFKFSTEQKERRRKKKLNQSISNALGQGSTFGQQVGTPGIVPASQAGGSPPAAKTMGVSSKGGQGAAQMGLSGPNYNAAAQAAFQGGDYQTGLAMQKMASQSQTQQAAAQKAQQEQARQGLTQMYRMGQAVLDPANGLSLDMAKQQLASAGVDPQMLSQITEQNLPQYMTMIEAQLGGNTQVLKDKEAVYDPLTGKAVYSNRGFTAEKSGDSLYGFNTGTGEFSNPVTRGKTFEEQETERSNQVQEAIDIEGNKNDAFANQTDRIEAQEAARSGGSFGKNVTYGVDANGNTIAYQLNDRGEARPVNFGEGVTALSPQQKSAQVAQGKADVKLAMSKSKAGTSLQAVRRKGDKMRDDIQKAIALVSDGNTGNIQGRLTVSQRSADLEGFLTTIRANSGFDELQAMRDSSPTGGALGQVSEKEIAFLQALKANTARTQSPELLKENLQEILSSYDDMIADYESRFEQDYNSGLISAEPRKSPSEKQGSQSLYDKYGLE